MILSQSLGSFISRPPVISPGLYLLSLSQPARENAATDSRVRIVFFTKFSSSGLLYKDLCDQQEQSILATPGKARQEGHKNHKEIPDSPHLRFKRYLNPPRFVAFYASHQDPSLSRCFSRCSHRRRHCHLEQRPGPGESIPLKELCHLQECLHRLWGEDWRQRQDPE